MSLSMNYQSKTDRLNKSYDFFEQAGMGNPYKLLCSAIVFQAAVDCEAIRRYGEGSSDLARYAKGAFQEMSIPNMLDFINGEWLEYLLSWTDCVSIEAIRENLIERLGINETLSS